MFKKTIWGQEEGKVRDIRNNRQICVTFALVHISLWDVGKAHPHLNMTVNVKERHMMNLGRKGLWDFTSDRLSFVIAFTMDFDLGPKWLSYRHYKSRYVRVTFSEDRCIFKSSYTELLCWVFSFRSKKLATTQIHLLKLLPTENYPKNIYLSILFFQWSNNLRNNL